VGPVQVRVFGLNAGVGFRQGRTKALDQRLMPAELLADTEPPPVQVGERPAVHCPIVQPLLYSRNVNETGSKVRNPVAAVDT
jgi:hypothetical protein